MPLIPKNRKEEWLQGLVEHETTMTPKNRPEEWMKEIIDASGGGGGTGGGALVCTVDMQTMALDKTWNEVNDAPFVVIKILDGASVTTCIVVETTAVPDTSLYVVKCLGAFGNDATIINATASSENGFPVFQF